MLDNGVAGLLMLPATTGNANIKKEKGKALSGTASEIRVYLICLSVTP